MLELENCLPCAKHGFSCRKKWTKSETCDTFKRPIFVGPGEAVRRAPCTKRGDDMTVSEILQLLSLLATVVLVVVTATKK